MICQTKEDESYTISGPPVEHLFHVSVVLVESAGSLVYLPTRYWFTVLAPCSASWEGGKVGSATTPPLDRLPPVAEIVVWFMVQSVGRDSMAVPSLPSAQAEQFPAK